MDMAELSHSALGINIRAGIRVVSHGLCRLPRRIALAVSSSLTAPAQQLGPLERYGIPLAAVGMILMFLHPWWAYGLPPFYSGERRMGLIVPAMLLLSHLADAFKWPRLTAVIVRLIAWVGLLGSLFYLLIF